MNRLLLHARLVERSALRWTPAGTPACDLGLAHESQATEAGQPRRVALELRAVALGELAQRIGQLPLGTQAGFAGFLASGRNGRGVVLHVTAVEDIAQVA
jgi:primosomal replication protein N